MRAILIDAWQKRVTLIDIPRNVSDSLFCQHISPDRKISSLIHETKELRHHTLARSGVEAVKGLTDMNAPHPSPMWMYGRYTTPLFGNGIVLGYNAYHGVYLPSPLDLETVRSNVEFL